MQHSGRAETRGDDTRYAGSGRNNLTSLDNVAPPARVDSDTHLIAPAPAVKCDPFPSFDPSGREQA
jgi:hypothetical protein